MAGVLVQCSSEQDGVRCQRRTRLIVPKGAEQPDYEFVCGTKDSPGCAQGQKPHTTRTAQRQGQQKQAKKK